MSRRVATITLNPAYDLVGFCPEIERGEVNLVKTTGLHAAGKGINVAKVLKDLGIDVTVGTGAYPYQRQADRKRRRSVRFQFLRL